MEFNMLVFILLAISLFLYVIVRLQHKEIKQLQAQIKLNGYLNEDKLAYVKSLKEDGEDVKAVKVVRQELGYSLVEAKRFVDSL